MCGIIGVAVAPTDDRSESDVNAIRFITLSMWLDSITRGKDAAGLATIDKNKNWHLAKAPLNAIDFRFSSNNAVDQFMKRISVNTSCIIGHVRLGTKGSKYDNENNHPIDVGNVLGVHNGVITNDAQLSTDLDLERTAEVDSEVIFNLINHTLIRNKFDIASIEEVFPLLRGGFAIASFTKSEPYRLLLAKRTKPIKMMYSSKRKVLIFASEYDFIEDAIYSCNEMCRMFDIDYSMFANEFSVIGDTDYKNEGIMLKLDEFDDKPAFDKVDVGDWDTTSGKTEYAKATTTVYDSKKNKKNNHRRSDNSYAPYGWANKDKDEDKDDKKKKKDKTWDGKKLVDKPSSNKEALEPVATTVSMIDIEPIVCNPFDDIESIEAFTSETMINRIIKEYEDCVGYDIKKKQLKSGARSMVEVDIDYEDVGARGLGKDSLSGLAYEVGYVEAAKRYFRLGFERALVAIRESGRTYGGWY